MKRREFLTVVIAGGMGGVAIVQGPVTRAGEQGDDTRWISLHSEYPGRRGVHEVHGRRYKRQPVVFQVTPGGLISDAAPEDFTDMPAVTITHMGVWSAARGGTLLICAALERSRAIWAGDTVRVGQVTVGC